MDTAAVRLSGPRGTIYYLQIVYNVKAETLFFENARNTTLNEYPLNYKCFLPELFGCLRRIEGKMPFQWIGSLSVGANYGCYTSKLKLSPEQREQRWTVQH